MTYKINKIFSQRNLNKALAQFGSISAKDFIIFSLIGIAIVLLITAIYKLAFKKKAQLSNVLAGMVLSVYGSIMLQLTLVCRESGSRIGIEMDIFHGLVGPENDLHWLMIAYAIMNCMLFIPFGFTVSLFSVINEKKLIIQFILVTLISFATSMLIELTQLIMQRGYYEMQDLAFNTLGGMIGWMIFALIYCVGTAIKNKMEEY